MRYPPVRAMINAVVKAPTLEAALADAAEVINALRPGGEPYKVLGPAPAPLSRLKGEHRAQFFVKGTQRAAMRKALLAALEGAPRHQAADDGRCGSDVGALTASLPASAGS